MRTNRLHVAEILVVSIIFLAGFASITPGRAIFHFTAGPQANWDASIDAVVIISVPFCDSENSDNIVLPANVTSAICEIYRDSGLLVASGPLSYVSGQWMSAGIGLAWKGSGNYYAVAKFTLTNGTLMTSPQSTLFARSSTVEDIVYGLAIIGGIGTLVILGILIYARKHSSADMGRKEKKQKKKEVKVLEISPEEIKQAQKGDAPREVEEKKDEKKGVTKKSSDLIFEVPKWEEDEGNK